MKRRIDDLTKQELLEALDRELFGTEVHARVTEQRVNTHLSLLSLDELRLRARNVCEGDLIRVVDNPVRTVTPKMVAREDKEYALWKKSQETKRTVMKEVSVATTMTPREDIEHALNTRLSGMDCVIQCTVLHKGVIVVRCTDVEKVQRVIKRMGYEGEVIYG